LRILRGDETVAGFETRKVEALFVFLACNRRPYPREILADLFWEERSQQQAQSNLRVALANLRKHLGDYLVIDRETVGLALEAPVWLDAIALESALEVNHGVNTYQAADQIEQAVSLYRGEFLAGFSVRDSREFEDWQAREQERLHRLVVETLHNLVEFDLQTGAYKAGLTHAARLLELDPLMEAAHRQMMALLASTGRRIEALSQYETLQRILRDELGLQPDEVTVALVQKIRAGQLEPVGYKAGFIRGYQIKEQIGAGNYGVIYRAFQPAVGREVAIKAILPQFANDPEFIRRFEVEAQIVARLEHPRIVPLYDYWREPDGAYLVMRWLKGGSLAEELARGPLALDRAADIIEQVASALSAAHRQGIVHRDLKPENVLLDEAQDAYLSDFGIAKDLHADEKGTASGALVGSPVYMSPEQILNQPLNPQSDIYSLGVLLYELLAGVLPFPNESLLGLIQKQLSQPLPSLVLQRPDLPPALDRVLERATAKDPAGRYSDALALAMTCAGWSQENLLWAAVRWNLPEVLLENPLKAYDLSRRRTPGTSLGGKNM
jgi:DNA-binding SARP family transcriptional activator